MEDKKQKKSLGNYIKDNMQKVIIFFVSIFYITQGVFQISKKNSSIWEILGSIILSIIVGVIISSSLSSMGMKDGRNSEVFIASVKAYGETKTKATPYFDKIQSWCSYKNAIELNERKKEIIQNSGLKWKLYKIGYYDEHKPVDKGQQEAIIEADCCKIYNITPSDLLADLPVNGSTNSRYTKKRFGDTESQYMVKQTVQNFASKIFVGVICGLYSLSPLITEDNVWTILANVLWNAIQIIMWTAFGLMKYTSGKSYMENEYRQVHFIQKTEYLNEFIATCQNNPSVFLDYNEDKEVDDYLKELEDERNRRRNEQERVNQ